MCKTCGGEIHQSGRGRPRLYCDECRKGMGGSAPPKGTGTPRSQQRVGTQLRVPCAGGCGRQIRTGLSRLPAGLSTCWPCRREGRAPEAAYRSGRAPEADCPICGGRFRPRHKGGGVFTEACGQRCSQKLWRRRAGQQTYESRRAGDRARCARRRMRFLAQYVEDVDPVVVFDRDGWRCHICRRKVDKGLSGRDRMGPTLDHLIPIAQGGEHSYANTALAHRSCNSRKGARPGATQLALVG